MFAVLCRMDALRAELAALKTEMEALEEGLMIDEMNKELADEIATNKKLLAEVEKLKGPRTPPPCPARTQQFCDPWP